MLSDEIPYDVRVEALFPRVIISLLNALDPSMSTGDLYVRYMSLINYAIVCGIGVLINQFVLHRMVNLMALWLANMAAILTAFLWNYFFTVGPLGYLFGLSSKREKLELE